MSDDSKVAMHPTATVVKKSVTVDVDQQRAFDVFTAGVNSWWQRDHHLGDLPMTDIIIEPKEGGRCYTTQEDGKQFEWAKVLPWDSACARRHRLAAHRGVGIQRELRDGGRGDVHVRRPGADARRARAPRPREVR